MLVLSPIKNCSRTIRCNVCTQRAFFPISANDLLKFCSFTYLQYNIVKLLCFAFKGFTKRIYPNTLYSPYWAVVRSIQPASAKLS